MKKIRVKRKPGTKENEEPAEEPMACPRRKKGDDGDCFACGS
jgi:hypothetical protein